jgi:HEAT repeat protein
VASLDDLKAALGKEKDAKVRDALLHAMGEIARTGIGRGAELETVLVAALADGDPHVRRSAAYALGCLAGQNLVVKQELPDGTKQFATDMADASWQALDNLVANDKEPMVRQNAAWALGKYIEVTLPSLGKALRDDDSLVKRDAASALLSVTRDSEKVRPMLKDLLKMCRDANSEVKRAALSVLVIVVDGRDKDGVPALKAAMEDRDVENRRNAALALSNIGGAEAATAALPVLLESARTGDLELRQQAIAGMSNLGPAGAKAVPELIGWLRSDPDVTLRRFAAQALGGIGAPSATAVPLLAEKIQDRKEASEVRVTCCMALAHLGKIPAARDVVPNLLQVLRDPQDDIAVRERVIWALRVHAIDLKKINGTEEAFIRVLKERPSEENRMFRYDCAYMLGMIWQAQAPKEAIDVLGQFLDDPNVKLYDRTVVGVGGIGTEIKGGVTTVKEQGKGDGRTMALDALQAIGAARFAQRKDIMAKLRALANDGNVNATVRMRSAELLKLAQ